ncbi:MAG: hypothetical protein EXS32_12525 [Opitutus sp.]|nr:hypothetical protein [Opitutus sp.]
MHTPKEELPEEYLQRIRATTCYATLRNVIQVSFALMFLGIVGATLLALASGFPVGGSIAIVIGSAIALSIGVAAYQSSLLLVDIADAQLDLGRRKSRNRSEEAAETPIPIVKTSVDPVPTASVKSIVASQAAQILTAPAASSHVSTVSPAVEAAAEHIIEQYSVAPDTMKTDVKKGCFIYFFAALAAVGLFVTALYFFFQRGK